MSLRTAWSQMISRCYDPDHIKYKNYGARGIRVCDRWICFRLFAEDMGSRPEGKTLNRKDNDGHYCPENCEWATPVEQAQNRTTNVKLTHDGKTLCVAEWSRTLGIPREALRNRLYRGWSVEEALTRPVRGWTNDSTSMLSAIQKG